MEVARIALCVMTALLLLTTGGGKLAGTASSHAIRDSLHVPASRWKLIGGLEVLGVVGLVLGTWAPQAGLAAAIGVVALMIGAVIARLGVGREQMAGVVGDVVVGVVAVCAAVLTAQAS